MKLECHGVIVDYCDGWSGSRRKVRSVGTGQLLSHEARERLRFGKVPCKGRLHRLRVKWRSIRELNPLPQVERVG